MNLIATKKRFLEYLERQIEDDAFIVLTQELTGQLTQSNKQNAKKVTFAFASDAFASNTGIGHIAFGKTPVLAICICKESDIAPEAMEKIKEAEKQTT